MEAPYLAPIELQRQQIIARNRARLLALGIPQAIEGLNKLVPAKPPKARRPKRPAGEPAQPSRHSVRLSDREAISRGEAPSGVEPGSELAMFIIDGECPRCGRVLSVGHARHLELCKGPPEPPTEEEIAAQAAAYRSEQKDRLKQLELGGLVDFYTPAAAAAAEIPADTADTPADDDTADAPAAAAATGSADAAAAEAAAGTEPDQQQQQKGPGKKAAAKKQKNGKQPAAAAAAAGPGGDDAYAVFIVIGSRGDHYTVTLRDEKRTCQCLDHRFRRHDCKHIGLILEQLGVADDPTAWQQALQQQLGALGAVDEDDVRRVKEAQQRAQQRQQKAADKAAAAADGALGAGVDGADKAAGEGLTAAAAAAAAAAGEDASGNASKQRKGAGRKRKASG